MITNQDWPCCQSNVDITSSKGSLDGHLWTCRLKASLFYFNQTILGSSAKMTLILLVNRRMSKLGLALTMDPWVTISSNFTCMLMLESWEHLVQHTICFYMMTTTYHQSHWKVWYYIFCRLILTLMFSNVVLPLPLLCKMYPYCSNACLRLLRPADCPTWSILAQKSWLRYGRWVPEIYPKLERNPNF